MNERVQPDESTGEIARRFRLTGELRAAKVGEWYWWTGNKGPAACKCEQERGISVPILVEREP